MYFQQFWDKDMVNGSKTSINSVLWSSTWPDLILELGSSFAALNSDIVSGQAGSTGL